jgi:hypothetical protein
MVLKDHETIRPSKDVVGPLAPIEATPCKSVSGHDDEILTVPEVAERLRVKLSWVYTHADLLGAYRLGKYLRFSWWRVRDRLNQAAAGRLGSQPNDLHQDQ